MHAEKMLFYFHRALKVEKRKVNTRYTAVLRVEYMFIPGTRFPTARNFQFSTSK